jgi:poly(ribitol-phosphate) beta-N-acetylglucosaminyltransferase
MEVGGAARAGAGRDITVVIPVFNTRPYLGRTLESLARQSIGPDRMQVVAVDDGSTDGSGELLDRYARRHGWLTVIHQPNSGGPAGPCNRALDVATGRYVMFLGADDYLGREALERMVANADRFGSDVLLFKMIGINNRFTSQDVFTETAPEISLFDSPLPYSLANTKLFRRELIERHHLRYPEDMPMGSDQPFTIEACVRAGRISVAADYDYYYIVRRLDAGNITYSSRRLRRLHSLQSIMTVVAKLIEPGPRRDAVLVRHFAWEAGKLLADDLLRDPPDVQEQVRAGLAELVELYLTDRIRAQLEPETRLRLTLARDAGLDDLLAVIEYDVREGVPPTLVEDGRWYARDPAFRNPDRPVPDAWFDVTDVAPGWSARLNVTGVSWVADRAGEAGGGGVRALEIVARSPLPDLSEVSGSQATVRAGQLTGSMATGPAPEGEGTLVRVRLRLDRFVADTAPLGGRRPLHMDVTRSGSPGSAPLRAPGVRLPKPVVRQHRGRLYAVGARRDYTGHLVVAVVRLTPPRLLAALRVSWSKTRRR